MNGEKIKTIKISGSQIKKRADKFLADFYPEKSRAEWQRIIKNEEILVNDKIIKADYILRESDEMEILKPSPFLAKGGDKNSLLTKEGLGVVVGEKVKIPDIKNIYEDDSVIVLDKPAGVLVHPAPSSRNFTLVDFLLKYYPKIKNVGENKSRSGIVHRLDKDTSGVIIAAKNNQAFEFLKDQFKNRKTQKIYAALVYGNVKPKEGEINFRIGRSKTNSNTQTVIDTKKKESIKSREARTVYKTIKNFKDYSLLEVSPKTGRMHQIRVHLKAIGHPLVGDQKYKFRKLPAVDLKRQFLHAVKLRITLPSGKVKIFKSELAEDLKEFLEKLE